MYIDIYKASFKSDRPVQVKLNRQTWNNSKGGRDRLIKVTV